MSSPGGPLLVNRRTFVALAAATAAVPAFGAAGAPQGRIETLDRVARGEGAAPRVRVWLPPGYGLGVLRYPTLYMLDGQFVFAEDADGENFAADRRITGLAANGQAPPALIIAIDNLEDDRFLQYMPQMIYDQAAGALRASLDREIARTGGRPLVSAPFIRFLTGQLKPFIDTHYRTKADRLNTAIFGASMAGVMAAAVFVEAQQAFGRAACISSNWPLYDQQMIDHPQLLSIWPAYFAQLGRPEGRKLWLDHGTEMMDAGMAPHQAAIARQLVAMGWRAGRNLEVRVHHGAGHAFASTFAQADDVLGWLLT